MALPVVVDVRLEQRLPAGAKIVVYLVLRDALTNVMKHRRARDAWVTIRREHHLLKVEVMDGGTGGALLVPGGVLADPRERVAARDRSLRLVSLAGGPTRVRADLPCAQASPRTRCACVMARPSF